jgi:uncharacterized protein YlxW (UPF0749 family)
LATFTAACYDDKGVVTMNETAKVQLIADKNAMSATVATHANKIKDLETSNNQLETSNIQLEADLENAKADNEMPAWAIAIIVVIGAVLLLVVVILAVVVSR